MRLTGARFVLAFVVLGLGFGVAEQTAFALCQPGTLCHSAVGVCDKDQFCLSNGICPTGFFGSDKVCRPPRDLCDKGDTCTGDSPDCTSLDAQQPAGTLCRDAQATGCDVAEFCTGSADACPSDQFASATTVCRSAVPGGCDVAESCTGSSPACPADVVEPSSKVCRNLVPGGCDVAEKCTGSSPSCPADVVEPSSKVCRPAVAGGCDVAEKCTGAAASCPADVVEPSSKVCRPAVAGGCDIAEKCTGAAATCPNDVLQPDDLACSDGEACTVGDACRGGACVAGGPPLLANMVDFGPALVGGNPRPATLMLEWRDTGNVAVTALSSSGPEFRVVAGQTFPIALSPSAKTASVAMEFAPTSLGARSATLTATLEPATCAIPMIDLTGTGSPPGLIADPTGSDFAQVEVGMTSPAKTFRVINLSGAEATIQSVTVSDAVNFALAADGLPAVVAADGSYSFTIAARPQTTGRHDADVVIASTSANNPMLSIHVEGTCAGGVCEEPGPGPGPGPGETPTEPGSGAVSPLACGVAPGSSGASWAWIGLAVFAVTRRRARRA